jgi:DNA-binding beta-propeller fold protein YncE
MLAILYLLVAVWIGDVLCRRFLAFGSVLHRLACAFVVGLVTSTWVTYLGVAAWPHSPIPLLGGDLLWLVFAFAIWRWWKREPATYLPRPPGRARWDVLLLALWLGFACWMMWASLGYSKDGVIHMAVRQWSDFGATLAIVQSFAIGHNFPPEYPHFAGPPLSYHFLFHFQTANLEWLGLKIHNSFNLLSALSFVCLAILIMTLGERLLKSRAIGRFGAMLFFFHCSLAYVPFLAAQPGIKEALKAILHKDGFLESIYTYRGELWGIWTLNIIANQRHLASALSLLLIVLIFLADAYDWRLSWPPPTRTPAKPKTLELVAVLPPAPVPPVPSPDEVVPTVTEPVAGAVVVEGAEAAPLYAASVPDTTAAPEASALLPPAAAALEVPKPVFYITPEPEPEEYELPPEPGPTPVPGGSRFDLLLASCFAGFLLGLLPLWNGAVFITAAVVLAGLFLIMPLRGYLVALGAVAGAIGIPQLILWRMGGAAANAGVYPNIHFGYVIDDPTFTNFFKFMAFTFGFKWLAIAAALVPLRWRRTSLGPNLGYLVGLLALGWAIFEIYHGADLPFLSSVLAHGGLLGTLAGTFMAKRIGLYTLALTAVALWLLYRLARQGVLGPVGSGIFLSTFGLVVLGFFVQFSIENAANHKFMFIWIAIINVGVAAVLIRIGQRGVFGVVAAALLTVSMTLGGLIDIFPFHNDGTIDIAMEHDTLMDFVLNQTDPRDVFLTDSFVAHPILLAGRKIFHGHDYYAWSAGYNTEERTREMKELYSERDPNVLVPRLNEYKIRWVCFDNPFSQGEIGKNEWVYRGYFRKAFDDNGGRHDGFRIYRVPTVEEWAKGGGKPVGPVLAPTPTPSAPAPAPTAHLSRGFGIAVANTGVVLVAEADSGAIQRIAPNGQFMGGLGMPDYKEPNGVAVDPNGFVYVADTWNQRIVKLTPDGMLVTVLPPPPGNYYAPRDLTTSPDGHVFVANSGRSEIVHYDASGALVASWGTSGTKEGELKEPLGVTVGRSAEGGVEVYVADYANGRIQVFTDHGKFLRLWAVAEWQGAPAWERPGVLFHNGRLYVGAPTQEKLVLFSPKGERLGEIVSPEFHDPSGLAVSREGKLYVMNVSSGTIVVVTLVPKTGAAAEITKFAPAPAPSYRRM